MPPQRAEIAARINRYFSKWRWHRDRLSNPLQVLVSVILIIDGHVMMTQLSTHGYVSSRISLDATYFYFFLDFMLKLYPFLLRQQTKLSQGLWFICNVKNRSLLGSRLRKKKTYPLQLECSHSRTYKNIRHGSEMAFLAYQLHRGQLYRGISGTSNAEKRFLYLILFISNFFLTWYIDLGLYSFN